MHSGFVGLLLTKGDIDHLHHWVAVMQHKFNSGLICRGNTQFSSIQFYLYSSCLKILYAVR